MTAYLLRVVYDRPMYILKDKNMILCIFFCGIAAHREYHHKDTQVHAGLLFLKPFMQQG